MNSGAGGVCPNCDSTGTVGDPCSEQVCRRRGYHFIPGPVLAAARKYAERRRKPLDPLLGRRIDKYLLCGVLGEGGMGAVYLAIQMPLQREVAVKLISGLDMDESSVARFEREARAVAALDHPNIVKLYDYGIGELDFRVPYMVLEYVRKGRNLKSALSHLANDGLTEAGAEVVLAVFRQVLHALSAAHHMGIVHRDMKPENVMLAPVEGNPYMVKLLDFGLAKAVGELSGFDGSVSRTGQILGTPYYMAPEQADPRRRAVVDGRADLYSVGVMLFEIFTGVKPYDGQTPLELLAKKVDPGFDPMDLPQAGSLPPELRKVLGRALERDPAGRYPDAAVMLEALEMALGGHTRPMGTGSPVSQHHGFAGAESGSPGFLGGDGEDEHVILDEEEPPRIPGNTGRVVVVGAAVAAAIAGTIVYLATGRGPGVEGAGDASVAAVVPATDAMQGAAPVHDAMDVPFDGPFDHGCESDGDAAVDRDAKPLESSGIAGAKAGEKAAESRTVAGSFVVDCRPTGAIVRIDGKRAGRCPLDYRVDPRTAADPGKMVEISVSAKGYRTVRVEKRLRTLLEDGKVSLKLRKRKPPRTEPVPYWHKERGHEPGPAPKPTVPAPEPGVPSKESGPGKGTRPEPDIPML